MRRSGYQAIPRRVRPVGRPLLVGVALSLLLVGCSTSSGSPAPGIPHPVSTPTAGASAATPELGRTAAGNVLYDSRAGDTTSCVTGGAERAGRQRRMQRLADCLTDSLRGSLAEKGIEIQAPRVVLAGHDQGQLCTGGGPEDWAGNYCPVNGTITLAAGGGDADSDVFLLSHEFGHHLQAVSGIWMDVTLAARGNLDEERQRRLELQAECFAGALTANTGPARLAPESRVRQITAYSEGDERWWPSHGRPETRRRWALAGGVDPQHPFTGCNTWSVGADQVR